MWRSGRSCCPNHQALSCRFHNFTRDGLQCVDLHETGDLCEEPVKQSEVATGHANNRREGLLIRHAFLGECHSGRHPLLLEELPHLRRAQWTKRMHEADP